MAEAHALRVEGLVIRASDGRSLLDVPRLELPAGGTLAVTGPSGAGKSSLLHALAGLLRPSRGRILWGGTDLAALPDPARARFRRERVGLVFQDFLLFEELGAAGNAGIAAAFAPAPERAAIRSRAEGWLGRLALASGRSPASGPIPAASGSAWPWPAPWPIRPPSSWPTSRPPASTAPAPTD